MVGGVLFRWMFTYVLAMGFYACLRQGDGAYDAPYGFRASEVLGGRKSSGGNGDFFMQGAVGLYSFFNIDYTLGGYVI